MEPYTTFSTKIRLSVPDFVSQLWRKIPERWDKIWIRKPEFNAWVWGYNICQGWTIGCCRHVVNVLYFFHASHASQDQSQGLRLQHFVKIMWCVLMDLYHLLLQLVTVFSAPNYCGEFDNAGGLLKVSKNLTCSFSIVPVSRHSSLVPRPFSKGLGSRLQTLWLARLPPDTHANR